MDRIFVDSNILLHCAIPDIGSDPPEVKLQKHEACLAQLQRLLDEGAELLINGQVIREFWAQATRYETEAGPMPLNWSLERIAWFRAFVHEVDETTAVRERLLILVQEYAVRGVAVHDANIVATMLAYDIDLVCTLDNDFDRYRKHITILSPLTSTT
ncbi:MAG: type II toxin-antitoxin system VapC family toxin [Anaerolineaceae bacterium]|nr:type II toxin-antitoxin system VapC family toxin [Anaerolineaceae bacterium]